MDTMFNNGHHTLAANSNHPGPIVVTPDDNDVIVDIDGDDDQTTATINDSSQSSLNKRKLTNGESNHAEQSNQDTETAKRVCTANGHH